MSTWKALIAGQLACLGLVGCTSMQAPIVAGAVDKVGVSIAGGTQEQGGMVVVGYRGAKFAVVPVETSEGNQLLLSDANGGDKGFSVFAMLGLDVKGATVSPCVGVSQVVAVGKAATTWAENVSRNGASGC